MVIQEIQYVLPLDRGASTVSEGNSRSQVRSSKQMLG